MGDVQFSQRRGGDGEETPIVDDVGEGGVGGAVVAEEGERGLGGGWGGDDEVFWGGVVDWEGEESE